MPELTFEEVLAGVESLPPESRARLREILNGQDEPEESDDPVNRLARAASLRDISAERRWLAEHRDEYVGEWVALNGAMLISHGVDLKTVRAEAKAAGHYDALLEKIDLRDTRAFIF
jgi:hypothetical protein